MVKKPVDPIVRSTYTHRDLNELCKALVAKQPGRGRFYAYQLELLTNTETNTTRVVLVAHYRVQHGFHHVKMEL